MLAAGGDSRDYVIIVAGDHYANRHLAVVGSVAGVERAAAVVKANFAVDTLAQRGVKRG